MLMARRTGGIGSSERILMDHEGHINYSKYRQNC